MKNAVSYKRINTQIYEARSIVPALAGVFTYIHTLCMLKLNLSTKFRDPPRLIQNTSGSFNPNMSLLNQISTLVDGELSVV